MTKTITTIVTKNGQIQKNVLRKGLAESSIALLSSPEYETLVPKQLWLYFSYLKTKKNLYNLRCCKIMQLEIGGLAMKTRFTHCLQPVVHYFKGRSVYI